MKSITKSILAAFAASALIPATALAADAVNQGYLIDVGGNIVTTTPNIGLCWRDSDWTPARSAEPCDPRQKLAAVTPMPVAASQPVQEKRRISFSADALFAFDKSVLKPEGKVMLDDLARQLKGADYDVIVATGHTDRLGSNQYNQKLSVRRANSVKDYLVSKDIPASRIEAEGKGETQPVTKAGDCKGAKSAKVIACLQPDRRVDVEMKGTKTAAVSR